MIKITYDTETGIVTGAYNPDCPEIPAPNIDAEYADYAALLAQFDTLKVESGHLAGVPTIDPTSEGFTAACTQFRAVCAQIAAAIGMEFKGGFDEYSTFITSQFALDNPAQAALFASMWSGANEYCKYEGAKLGYGQPEWWYACWEIE